MMMTAMINMLVMALMWILMAMMIIIIIGGDSVDVAAGIDADADVDGGEWGFPSESTEIKTL